MTEYSPTDLAAQLKSGLLSFPVTHFTDDLEFDEAGYRKHLAWLAELPRRRAVRRRRHRRGLLAHPRRDRPRRPGRRRRGRGRGPGARARHRQHRQRDRAGPGRRGGRRRRAAADAALPHRGQPGRAGRARQPGLRGHRRSASSSTAAPTPSSTTRPSAALADRNPTLIGFKDGVGNIEQMTRTYARVGDRLTYIGGLPTAETFALPLLQLGVSTYSSALFNFVPAVGARVLRRRARPGPRRGLPSSSTSSSSPTSTSATARPGYAVSIVKAGLAAIGRPAGPVRPPLTDLRDDEVAELRDLIARIS